MIVLDASAVVELLLETAVGRKVALRIADPSVGLHAPHLIDVEVAQAVRRYASVGELSAADARAALDDLLDLDLQRHSHEPLLGRAWQLRDNVTIYDAVYVALAEALGAVLLTCDAKLARSRVIKAGVELVQIN